MKFLFDLGGIFFNWDPVHFYKDIFSSKEEMNYFLNKICNDDWNLQQDSGRTIKEAESELISYHPKYKEEIKMYYLNHRKMIKNTYKESIEALLELKSKNYFCYVLSNWSSETFLGMIDEYPFLKKFDDLIISGEVKLIKPDHRIFNLAISKFKLIPEETVFIDDRKENIESALKLNFKTIHLTNPNLIKEEIYKFLY
tara:strand:+ start:9569 stop:10162 length:594 start_codon:yes stop_codon:yes gene_type:complete